MKKLFRILLTLGLVATYMVALLPTPVLGQSLVRTKITKTEVLNADEVRLDKNTKRTLVGEVAEKDIKDPKVKDGVKKGLAKILKYTTTTSTLPETLDDLTTLITLEWIPKRSLDNVLTYETGNNIFYARATNTRVSVEYKGALAAWDPIILAGTNILKLVSGPDIVDDPINPYYRKNTVKWTYQYKPDSLGGFFGQGTVTITRYLRQIEGSLQEYYILDKDPGLDIVIKDNYRNEKNFIWDSAVYANDAKGIPLLITSTETTKTVSRLELARKGLTYPVTIDPSPIFNSISYDGYIYNSGSTYSTVRTATSGYYVLDSGTTATLGQDLNPDNSLYYVFRDGFHFDTSTLPDSGLTITDVQLKLWGYTDGSDTDFSLIVQGGGNIYPSIPMITSDYNQSLYSGSYNDGYPTSSWTNYGYNSIVFNASGRTTLAIKTDGYTRFIVRSSRDINNNTPTGHEYVAVFTSEYGSNQQPVLQVSYSLIVNQPTVTTITPTNVETTSALLGGYLNSDGGAACSVGFYWGPAIPYASQTYPFLGGYTTGQYFYSQTAGFSPGTVYNVTGVATHGSDPSSASNVQFVTKPGTPTGIGSTVGNGWINLTWTKGQYDPGITGKTMVRYGTGSYPSFTSGTSWYFGTASTTNVTGLTNGTTYYFSLFSYVESGTLSRYSTEYLTTSDIPETVGPPSGSTLAATYYTSPPTAATLNGNLNSLGNYANTDCYFEWYKSGDPAWGHTTIGTLDTLTAPGNFSDTIGPLLASTLYYFRAVLDNTDPGAPVYGSPKDFTTGAISAPVMTASVDSPVPQTTATLRATVTDDGDGDVIASLEWGTTTGLGNSSGAGPSYLHTGDQYPYTVDNLVPGTVYYYRSKGVNSLDPTKIGYSTTANFTTATPSAPTIVADTATNVGASSAVLNSHLVSDGGQASEVRFIYGENTSYASNTTWVPGYTSGMAIVGVPITGLSVSTTYHYQAQAKNSNAVTNNSTDMTFTTVFIAPTNFRAIPLDDTSIDLLWTNQGDQTYVMGKSGAFPVDRLDGDLVYFGPSSSFTDRDLLPGTTYFYRAWSWRTGGVFSTDYSDEASTTTSGTEVAQLPEVDISGLINEPTSGGTSDFQETTDNQTYPGHEVPGDAAVALGMPRTSGQLLFGVAMLVLVVGGLLVGTGQPLMAGGGGVIVTIFLVGLHILPMWFLIAWIFVCVAIALTVGLGGIKA